MSKIKINTIRTLKEAIKIYEEFSYLKSSDKKITFDFSKASFIYSNFTALLGALIEKCADFEVIIPKNDIVKTVLCKNNFLPTFTELPKLNDLSQSVIEYEKFNLHDIDAQTIFFDKLLNKKLLKEKGLTNLSDKVLVLISKSVIELFDNAREHSKSKQGIYIAAQFFPKKHKLDFTIVDMGIGIKSNVNSFLKEQKQAGEAISWAMKRQHSTRVGEPGGLGLALLKELIIKSNGKMEVISNDGYYFIKNEKEGFENLDIDFEGTIINIEFSIDGKHYFLKEELEE